MSIATSSARPVGGATGSDKGSVLWSQPASLLVGDRQILVRVDRGGIEIGEGELRYQLECKDAHPLARADELLDVLADLEARGLLQAELCFRLTVRGREQLAVEPERPVRSFAVMEDDSVLCADCVQEVCREPGPDRAEAIVHAWIEPGPGVCCRWCSVSAQLDDDRGAGS
jgi:hypothetical protein